MAGGKQSKKALKRSAARLAAVQALYDMDLSGHRVSDVDAAFFERGATADLVEGEAGIHADPALFRSIVSGVVERNDDFVAIINTALPAGRKLAAMEVLLQVILKSACFELTSRADIDPPITINEYVNLTKAFFTGREAGIVNALLDQLARVVRADEAWAKKEKPISAAAQKALDEAKIEDESKEGEIKEDELKEDEIKTEDSPAEDAKETAPKNKRAILHLNLQNDDEAE
jgi:N utilization substance protein B